MAGLPRDSLVARMLQRGTLPGWNLFEVPKGPSWSQSSTPVQGPGKASATSSASTSVGATSSGSKSSSSAVKAVSGPVSTVVALAKKIRHSIGKALAPPAPPPVKPNHRKVGKQRPSVPPKPRHRKIGKQRPSHLAPPPQLRPPPPEQKQVRATVPAASPAVPAAKAAAAPAAKAAAVPAPVPPVRKNSGGKQKKSESVERTPPKKRSSAALQQSTPPAVAAPVPPPLPPPPARPASTSMAPKKTVKKPKAKEPITKRMKLTTPKCEEDNYDISDMEEDEEGNRIEPDRQGKRIPAWCVNYATLAAQQADIDPDSIFGTRMPLCDLDCIFPDSFYRSLHPNQPKVRRRGSSCHWFRDALTPHEIHAYAVKMGQSRSWSTVRASLPGPPRPSADGKVVALMKPPAPR